ncbi:MAG: hypothetical protein DCC49_01250 [Acidobacteria bacterium]|nr:MAG: hypothetical protein DCC49_01250 [Acidobacteriota bacterium]
MVENLRMTFHRVAGHRRRDWLIFGVAVATGILYFATMMDFKVGAAGDTPTYVELSRGVFTGSGFRLNGVPSATYPPGYPLFIAPFVALFGEAGRAVVAAQWLVGGAAAVLVARIARVIYGPSVAVVAGLGAATAPQLAMWEAYPISDVLGLSLLLLGVFCLVTALPPIEAPAEVQSKWQRIGRAGAAGAALGASALVRPLSLSLGLPAVLWIVSPWIRASKRLRASMILCAIAGMLVVIAPWGIRNAAEFGGFYPLSTRNGWQLIQATEWTLQGRGTVGVDVTYPEEASGLSEGEADRVLTRIALERMRQHPADFASRAGLKVLFLWLPTAPGLGPASLAMGIQFCVVAIFAACAFFFKEARRGLIFWAMSAGASLGVAFTILDPDYRYRLPVLLVLMPPAAWGLVHAVRRLMPQKALEGTDS